MKFALPVFICALFVSCFNEGDCLISATNFMHLQFKKRSNITLDTAIDFTTVSFSGTDSVFVFQHDTVVTEILIPVDVSKNLTTFIFNRRNPLDTAVQAIDTLQVGYSKQSKIISPACGAFLYCQNLKILKTSLDSAQIKIFSTSLIKDPTTSGISAYAVNYQIFY